MAYVPPSAQAVREQPGELYREKFAGEAGHLEDFQWEASSLRSIKQQRPLHREDRLAARSPFQKGNMTPHSDFSMKDSSSVHGHREIRHGESCPEKGQPRGGDCRQASLGHLDDLPSENCLRAEWHSRSSEGDRTCQTDVMPRLSLDGKELLGSSPSNRHAAEGRADLQTAAQDSWHGLGPNELFVASQGERRSAPLPGALTPQCETASARQSWQPQTERSFSRTLQVPRIEFPAEDPVHEVEESGEPPLEAEKQSLDDAGEADRLDGEADRLDGEADRLDEEADRLQEPKKAKRKKKKGAKTGKRSGASTTSSARDTERGAIKTARRERIDKVDQSSGNASRKTRSPTANRTEGSSALAVVRKKAAALTALAKRSAKKKRWRGRQ